MSRTDWPRIECKVVKIGIEDWCTVYRYLEHLTRYRICGNLIFFCDITVIWLKETLWSKSNVLTNSKLCAILADYPFKMWVCVHFTDPSHCSFQEPYHKCWNTLLASRHRKLPLNRIQIERLHTRVLSLLKGYQRLNKLTFSRRVHLTTCLSLKGVYAAQRHSSHLDVRYVWEDYMVISSGALPVITLVQAPYILSYLSQTGRFCTSDLSQTQSRPSQVG